MSGPRAALTTLVLSTSVLVVAPTDAGAASTVAITELHYHPESDDQDEEVVELHNPGPDAVDLGGWCFDEGISHCFAPGTSVPAGGFLLGTPDLGTFAATYGGTADFEYGGNLSNGGETVRLVDDSSQPVEELTYDDTGPWPTTPDGRGPSLERRDPTADPDTPRSWAASTDEAGHTVGQASSVAGVGLLPGITEVTEPAGRQPDEPVTVTAAVEGADVVTLVHVVDFDAEVRTAMLDDGNHGDGAADDGTYGATIPGQPAGSLVRYRVEAVGTEEGATNSEPRIDDTRRLLGHTVADPTVDASLPVLEWFMPEADYQHLVTNPTLDEWRPAVFAFDGVAHDGAQVRVQGSALGRLRDKVKWKVELAPGHLLDVGELATGPLDELSLDSAQLDPTKATATTAWATAAASGHPEVGAAPVRVQRNGALQGVYVLTEGYDDEWRDRQDLDDALLYEARLATFSSGDLEAQFTRRNGEDDDALQTLLDAVDQPDGPARRAALREHLDLPRVVNVLALNAVLGNTDARRKNLYLLGDAEERGRWSLLVSDLDQTMGIQGFRPTSALPVTAVDLALPLLTDPDVLAMYARRLRTLLDEQLTSGALVERLRATAATTHDVAELDAQLWPLDQLSSDEALAHHERSIAANAALLATDGGAEPLVAAPPAGAAEDVRISELHYHPIEGEHAELVELANPSADEAVDLSGWQLAGGVDATLPAGSVVPPGGHVLVVNDDPGFRAEHGADHLVLAEHDGNLSNGGEQIQLLDADGQVLDEVDYDDGGDWPSSPDGDGPSLERVDLQGDGSDPASWAPSEAPGGTPGRGRGEPAAPDLVVVPTVAPGHVEAGDPASVGVEVHNVGASALGPLTVSSPSAPDCEVVIPTVAPGSSETVACTRATTQADVGTLLSRLTVEGGPRGPRSATSIAVVVDTTPVPLDVQLEGPATVTAGEQISVTATVTNPTAVPVDAELVASRGTCASGPLELRAEGVRTLACTVPTTDPDDVGELVVDVEATPRSGALALAGTASTSITVEAPAEPHPGFPDVPPDAFYADAIAWMAEQGITTGYGDGTFRPAEPVTRLAIASFLHRLVGEPEPTAPEPFPDVPDDAFYADAIAWMAEQGITTGYGNGTFRPAEPVTRLAIAAFLHRLASTASAWGTTVPPPSVLF